MEHKTISIRHKVIEAEVDGKFVPMGEDVLKTKSSFRTLPLIPAVGIILLEEKEKQEMYRRLFKKSYCRDYLDYICVDQCGKLLRPNYATEHFPWLIEKYGLRKVRFHDLRHTCASLLLSNGISMKQIQIWLRHSTFSTTADIYAHLDYLRINELITPLKRRIDDAEFPIVVAVQLSYLTEQEQQMVDDVLSGSEYKVNEGKVVLLREYTGKLTPERTEQILSGEFNRKPKKSTATAFKVKPAIYKKYFTASISQKEFDSIVDEALALYFAQKGQESEQEAG